MVVLANPKRVRHVMVASRIRAPGSSRRGSSVTGSRRSMVVAGMDLRQ